MILDILTLKLHFLQSKLYFIQLPWLLTRCKIFSATLKSGYFGNFDSRSQNQQGFKIRRNRARKKSPTKIDQQVTTVSKMVSFTKVQFFYEIYRLFFTQNPQSDWDNNHFRMKFSKVSKFTKQATIFTQKKSIQDHSERKKFSFIEFA